MMRMFSASDKAPSEIQLSTKLSCSAKTMNGESAKSTEFKPCTARSDFEEIYGFTHERF